MNPHFFTNIFANLHAYKVKKFNNVQTSIPDFIMKIWKISGL